jgi:hypothetical protein
MALRLLTTFIACNKLWESPLRRMKKAAKKSFSAPFRSFLSNGKNLIIREVEGVM